MMLFQLLYTPAGTLLTLQRDLSPTVNLFNYQLRTSTYASMVISVGLSVIRKCMPLYSISAGSGLRSFIPVDETVAGGVLQTVLIRL